MVMSPMVRGNSCPASRAPAPERSTASGPQSLCQVRFFSWFLLTEQKENVADEKQIPSVWHINVPVQGVVPDFLERIFVASPRREPADAMPAATNP
jgi:hypothetical protein